MNTRNIYLFASLCFSILLAACSNGPVIKSATKDKVDISSPPEQFIEAYDLAKKECEKYTKTTQYIPDNTVDLKDVAFECVGEDIEVVAEATEPVEETATEVEEVMPDAETEVEVETESETLIEDVEEEAEKAAPETEQTSN